MSRFGTSQTLPAYFRDAVDRFPDEPLFRRAEGGVLTCAPACRWSVALADRLVELGIRAGSFVVSSRCGHGRRHQTRPA